MPDLLWDDRVAWLLDPTGGDHLPDVFIADTTVADWQAVLDLVEERGWAFEYAEGGRVLPLFPEGGGTEPLLGYDVEADRVRVLRAGPGG